MKDKNKPTIVYIKPNNSSFIKIDQEIFEKYFDLKSISLSQTSGKILYGVNLIKLFFTLLSFIFRKNVVFICWFADYHAAVMVLAAKLIRKKSAIIIGGMEAVSYKELNKGVYRSKFRGSLVKFALKNTNLISANHESLIYHENYYYNKENPHIDGIKHYVKGLKTPTVIINNGIDTKRFVRDNAIKKDDKFVLTVGTMNQLGDFYNKGFDLFIEVARRNPQLNFRLIGLKPEFEAWTEENYQVSKIPNLEIIKYFCPHELLRESYNKAKVFVQASITEGMPNTLGEAMLLECIPVGSNVNGIPDAIGDTGVIVKHRSADELEEAIKYALTLNTASKARQRVIDLFSFEIREKKLKELALNLFH